MAAAIAGLVAVSALFAIPPLTEVDSGSVVEWATLTRPGTYLVGAPLFSVWDTLTLLTASEHYAVLVTLVGGYLLLRGWRVGRTWRAARSSNPLPKRSIGRRVFSEALLATASLSALVVFYLAGVVMPRPMVGLAVDGPDRLVIDFHSHTERSHDGRPGFGSSDRLSWHAAGGFDVAYLTDHYTWRGVDDAAVGAAAGEPGGVLVLEGAELRIHGRPTNALGSRTRYLPALGDDSIYLRPDELRRGVERGGRRPTLLFTMPGALASVVPISPADPAGVVGIEVVDGSPRGLEQTRRDRARIVALADSARLALVAASNHHGWAYAVAGWNVMEIEGWRAMTSDSMASAIEARLHDRRRDAVTVLERGMPYPRTTVALASTVPRTTWGYLRRLSFGERLSWLAWLALLAGVRPWRRVVRFGSSTT